MKDIFVIELTTLFDQLNVGSGKNEKGVEKTSLGM